MNSYDIIGDIHGCFDELLQLIDKLGYSMENDIPIHPDGRPLAFVGDAMDRGPDSVKTLNFMFRLQDARNLFIPQEITAISSIAMPKGIQSTQHGIETTVAELDTSLI